MMWELAVTIIDILLHMYDVDVNAGRSSICPSYRACRLCYPLTLFHVGPVLTRLLRQLECLLLLEAEAKTTGKPVTIAGEGHLNALTAWLREIPRIRAMYVVFSCGRENFGDCEK